MAEPREDMLPDIEGTQSEVKEVPETPVTKDVKPKTKPESISPSPAKETAPVVETESKGIPYSRYKEKTQEVKELKKQIQNLEAVSTPEYEEDSERVTKLEAQVKDLTEGKEVDQVVDSNPALVAKADEFAEFRDSNPHLSPNEAKAVFLDDQGVSEESPQGLEKPTGGPKEPPTSGFTPEQVEDLRVNHPRRYERMVQDGDFVKVDWGKNEGSFGG